MIGNPNDNRGKVSNKALFRVGAKNFVLTFDGGRTAPNHITERRGKFFGSLWLDLTGLQWLLAQWASLRQVADSKWFFRFYRTGYSILEFSCLQNHHGHFVEVAEYHGGAQRGGLRVPEGYRGKGWARFEREVRSFFLGMAVPAMRSRNGKNAQLGELRESRDIPAIASQTYTMVNSGVHLNYLGQARLDKDAPRPTRKTEFKWNPIRKTLRITYGADGQRYAEWVDLRFKAHGLKIGTQTKTQIPTDVSRRIVSPDPPLAPSVNASLTEELPATSSSSDESETASELPESPRSVVAEPLVLNSPISEAWVDLAVTEHVPREIVVAETPALSYSQFEQGQSS